MYDHNTQPTSTSVNTKLFSRMTFVYANLLALLIFFAGLIWFGYQQLVLRAPLTGAYPTSPQRPARALSFQGRLIDTAGNPITTTTAVQFYLYNSGPSIVGGTQLWDSGSCNITPDQDGIFSVSLGSDCGTEIPANVFSENLSVWLEVHVGAETLSPRQRILTSAYSLNTETIQGYPISATGAATLNTVLVMDNSGDVVLGETSPGLRSISGTFAIEGRALLLQTSSGSNGDITMSPDGVGGVIITSTLDVQDDTTLTDTTINGTLTVNGTTALTGYLAAPGATFSATYAGGTALIARGGPAGTANILALQNNGGSNLLTVDSSGNISSLGGVAHSVGNSGGNLTLNSNGTIELVDNTNVTGAFHTTGAISSDSTITGTTVNGGTVKGTSGINTGGGAGTQRIDGSGNLTNIGTTQFNSITYSWPGSQSSGYILQTNGSGVLTWADPAVLAGASTFWNQANGSIFTKNSTVDLLVGGQSTDSAKFAVLNVNSGTPTASIAGSVAGYGLSLTGDGTIATTLNRSLALNPNGGNVGIGTSNPLQKLDVRGVGRFDSTGGSYYSELYSNLLLFSRSGANYLTALDAGGSLIFRTGGSNDRMTIASNGLVGIGTTSPTAPLHVNAGYANNDAFTVNQLNSGNIFTASSSGTTRLTLNNNGNLTLNTNNAFVHGTKVGGTTTHRMIGINNSDQLQIGEASNAVPVYIRAGANGSIFLNNSNGYAGIGTTSPGAKLDVNGDFFAPIATFSANYAGGYPVTVNNGSINITQNGNYGIHWGNADKSITNSGNNLTISQFDSTIFKLWDGVSAYTEVARFKTPGLLGLGTNSPTAPLHVRGAYGNNAAAIIDQRNSGNVLTASASGTTVANLDTSGNLAIEGALSDLSGGTLSINDNLSITGNLLATGTTTFNSQTYTWPGSITNGYVLQTDGSGVLTWADPAVLAGAATYWLQNNGALYPKNSTVDFLVGGQSTDSAKFAVLNVNSGTPTASISGSTAGYGLYMTGDGSISTTLNRSLALNPNGGNVGIGTSSPLSQLHISGDGGTSGLLHLQDSGIGTVIRIRSAFNTAGDTTDITFTGSSPTIPWAKLGTIVEGTGDMGLAFYTTTDSGATTPEKLRITHAGNVGIGISTPQSLLHLSHANANTGIILSELDEGVNNKHWQIKPIGGGAANFTIGELSDDYLTFTEYFRILNNSGNVGIGDTNPTEGKLTLSHSSGVGLYSANSSTGIGIHLANTAVDGDPRIALDVNGGAVWNIGVNDGDSDKFMIGDAGGGTLDSDIHFTIDTNGNIGIGTTNPGAKFDVVGDLHAPTATFSANYADGKALIAKGGPSGTANILSVQNSSGTDLAFFDSSGNLTLNAQNDLRLADSDSTNYVALQSPATVGSNLTFTLPDVYGTSGYVLSTDGTGTLSWVDNGAGGSGSAWTIANGSLYPINETLDLLVGGTATAAAKAGFINITAGTPTATVSAGAAGGAYLSALGNLATTAMQTLTLGGATTGDILLQPNGDTTDYARLTSDGTDLTLATTDSSHLTLAPAGQLRFFNSSSYITSAGNLTLAGDAAINGGNLTAANPLSIDVTGGLTLNPDNQLILNSGAGSTILLDSGANLILDADTGIIAFRDSNATFATLTQSSTDAVLDITGGQLILANTNSINIGGVSNLAYNAISDSGTATFAASDDDLYIEDILEVAGSLYLAGKQISASALWQNTLNVFHPGYEYATIADLTIGGSATASAKFHVNATTGDVTLANQADLRLYDSGSFYTGFQSPAVLGATTLYTLPTGDGANGAFLKTNGSGALSWETIPNYWRLADGALSPVNNTLDLLIGSTATTSAKAGFININDGTPTATLSAGAAGGSYLSATGLLATTANQTLSLGSATTGNIQLNPGGTTALTALINGDIGIGTSAPNAQLDVLTTSGSQLRLSYDTSNYLATTIGSTGATTLATAGTGGTYTFNSSAADGAVTGFTFNTTNTLSNASAKVASIQNNSTELFYVDAQGNVWAKGNVYTDKGYGLSMKNIGVNLNQYDLVVINTTENNTDGVPRMSATSSANTNLSYGVVQESCTTGSTCKVVTEGETLINANAATNRGDYLYASTTMGQAAPDSDRLDGIMAVATSDDTTGPSYQVEALLLKDSSAPNGNFYTQAASVAHGSYIEITHSQGTNDIIANGWFTDGSTLFSIDTATQSAAAVGGTITTDGIYNIHRFTSDGTFLAPGNITADVLLVGGGGSGGAGSGCCGPGGGGGAGDFVYQTSYTIPSGFNAVVVGDGGPAVTGPGGVGNANPGNNGEDTVFAGLTAIGGGGGGAGSAVVASKTGKDGGSGGGGGTNTGTAGTQTGSGTGNNGANGSGANSGGGGGAGAAGSSTAGGNGLANSITGVSVTYAGGGGGALNTSTGGAGGSGGGGAGGTAGAAGTAGTANTGGGGGGGGNTGTGANSGAGGSGVVIVRYDSSQVSNPPYQIVQTDSNTVRLYNFSGVTKTLRLDAVVKGSSGGSSGSKWQINAGSLSPLELGYDINLGATASSAAKISLAGALDRGRAALIVNQTENQDIFAASASGLTRFRIANDGYVFAPRFSDQANSSYFFDGAATDISLTAAGKVGFGSTSPEHQLQVNGVQTGKALSVFNQNGGDQSIFVASQSGTRVFEIGRNGDTTIGNTTTEEVNLTVNGDVVQSASTEITSSIDNITDIFIYDTTKDSDGGRWTNDRAAQSKTWYTEAKDDGVADACSVSGDDRCGAATFPKKAILVTTTDALYIFDAVSNKLWMKFSQGTSYALGVDTNNNPSSVYALDGSIYVATNGSAATGLYEFNFKTDQLFNYNATNRISTYPTENINDRNTFVDYGLSSSTITSLNINNATVNDVYATVISGKTYVVAATDNAIAVINKTDLRTLDYSDVSGDDYNAVWLTKAGRLYALNETQAQLERWDNIQNQNADRLAGSPLKYWDNTTTPALSASAPTIQTSSGALFITEGTSFNRGDTVYVSTNQGMTRLNDSPSEEYAGSVKYFTKDYITEEMFGAVRAMYPFSTDYGNGLSDASLKGETLEQLDPDTFIAFTGENGVRGEGVQFDGISGLLCTDANCGGTSNLDFVADAEFSISLWFNSFASSSVTPILGKGSGTNTIGYRVYMDASDNICFGIDDDSTSFPEDNACTSGYSYDDEQWHHVVAAKDGRNRLVIYVDGVQRATDDNISATGTLDNSGSFLIGGGLVGYVDEVMVTRGLLEENEIATMYLTGRQALVGDDSSYTGSYSTDNEVLGSTSTSTAVSVVGNLTYIGTNDGSDGGGVSVIDMKADRVIDAYYDGASVTDETGTAWTGTDFDDISAIAVDRNTTALGSITHYYAEKEEKTLSELGSRVDSLVSDATKTITNPVTQGQFGYTPNLDTWKSSGGLLPFINYNQSIAVIGDYVYSFGGNIGSNISRAPVSNPTSWINTGATLPASLTGSHVAVIGDYVYLFGGNTGAVTNAIYRAPVSDPTNWTTTGNTLPGARQNGMLAVIGDYVYLFGGWNGSASTNTIYRAPVSDPTNWSNTGNTLPGNLSYSTAVVIDNYVYTFGGYVAAATNVIYRAPISDPTSWSNTGATMPVSVYAALVTIVGDHVYYMGGYTGAAAASIVYRAPLNNPLSWKSSGGLAFINSHTQPAIIGDRVYTFGGFNGGAINTIQEVDIVYQPTENINIYNHDNDAIATPWKYAPSSLKLPPSYNGYGADLAEWYLSHDLSAEAGDVVIVDPDHDVSVAKSSKASGLPAIGVISTQAAITLGSKDGTTPGVATAISGDEVASGKAIPVPVALAGRVPVKVSMENGVIKKGDALTLATTPGVAAKALSAGQIIGYAMEDLGQDGLVMTFVQPGSYVPDTLQLTDLGDIMIEKQPTPPSLLSTISSAVTASLTDSLDQTTTTATELGSTVASAAATTIAGASQVATTLASVPQATWTLTSKTTNQAIQTIAAYSQAVIGYLRAGKIETQELVADDIETKNITTDTIQTNSDLAIVNSEQTAVVNITDKGDVSLLGDLNVATNASIAGNLNVAGQASISGELSAHSARLEQLESQVAQFQDIKTQTAEIVNATVSGTLYANTIANLDEKIATAFKQPSLLELLTISSKPAIQETVAAPLADLGYLPSATSSSQTAIRRSLADLNLTATDSVITGQAGFINQYFDVNGSAYIADSLGVGSNLAIGTTLTINTNFTFVDGSISYQPTTEQLAAQGLTKPTLQLQPTGFGSINLLAGTMTLDDSGLVTIHGDLIVAGNVTADSLLTGLIEPKDYTNPLQVKLATRSGQVAGATTDVETKVSRFEIVNELGTPVATISAGGKASFEGGVGVGSETVSTAQETPDQATATKTSGKATIKANTNQLTISSQLITEKSLIYVTPVGSTGNQVLYVKEQSTEDSTTEAKEGKFVVGFDNTTTQDVTFNWWIVN